MRSIVAVRFQPTPLADAIVLDLDVIPDQRGGFARSFCESEFAEAGLPARFPQSNLSYNTVAGTLRGLHFNAEPFGEAKLVRVVRGEIRDVIVDLRADSATRFQWFSVDLSAENGRALFVPEGFAHGFITLVDQTDVLYQVSAEYRPGAARTIAWDDPAFGIDWGREPTVMSERDRACPPVDLAAFDLSTYGGG